jgi:hypothetical protein
MLPKAAEFSSKPSLIRGEKMKKSINKTKLIATITSILFIVSIIQTAIPIQAQDPFTDVPHGGSPTDVEGYPDLGSLPSGVTPDYTLDKIAYMSFRPNPVGVGQSVLVNIWTTPGAHHSIYMHDYKVTIQDPAGNEYSSVMDSYLGDCSAWFEFVPDIPGTWRLKFESPGTYIPAGTYIDRPGATGPAGTREINFSYSIYYKPSETDWQELTVQEDMVYSWPPSDLPTDYWTRPVNPINREWWEILGSYPWTGAYYYPNGRVLYGQAMYGYTAYVQAPNTAHIAWKRLGDPAGLAGLIGGETYTYSMSDNAGTPSLILAGRCYQSVTKIIDGQDTNVWQCYDLRTGEVYWERTDVTQLPQVIEFVPPMPSTTVAGAEATSEWSISLVYLGGGRLIKYDPADGSVDVDVSTSPISASISGFFANSLFYNNRYVLSVQNLGAGNYRLINWTTTGGSDDFADRVMNNITWPKSSIGQVDFDAGLAPSASLYRNWPPEVDARAQPGAMGYMWCIGYEVQSIDLYTGKELFFIASDNTLENYATQASVSDRGKVAYAAANRRWICYNARTGVKEWESEQMEYPWGAWFPYARASYDFNETKGAIITGTYEGVYAIDWDDGSIIWHYQDSDAVPYEGPYTTEDGSPATPFFSAVTIADGKVFAYNSEHSPSLPRDRGWGLHCINATTGELIWKILNPMVPGAVADGYLTASNPYDGYMYVFGKGESATTVTAPKTSVPLGSSVVIEGTVLDQSPAQPNTPCVSADSMSTQMEYLHLQLPIDGRWHNETITGVEVTLTAIDTEDPMNVVDLGTVTSNGYTGKFGMEWTPTAEGFYEIYASFGPTEGYGSSSASTFVSVGPAPEETQTPEPSPSPEPEHPIISLEAALIIATVVIAAVIILAWALMRRK